MTPAGFPHSDISGSTPACDSPKLFAANHVLHRLLTPRHSPCALSSLVTNLKIDWHHATFSVAIRRLQGRVISESLVDLPLTLDCFVRNRSCNRFERCTQDTLSRRCLLFGFQRARKGGNSTEIPYLRQDYSLVERKGFEPSTPGLQSRCSPS
jgi:hypothetical protein